MAPARAAHVAAAGGRRGRRSRHQRAPAVLCLADVPDEEQVQVGLELGEGVAARVDRIRNRRRQLSLR